MSKADDVLERAYGNIPRECSPNINIDFLPTRRGIKYYWLVFLRKLTR